MLGHEYFGLILFGVSICVVVCSFPDWNYICRRVVYRNLEIEYNIPGEQRSTIYQRFDEV
jgi:hypothetical protein